MVPRAIPWTELTGVGGYQVRREDQALHLRHRRVFAQRQGKEGKSILFEAQLGALRDLDYGIYPYTTSSNTMAAYAPMGAGLPRAKIDEVVGVVKAYSSCVGEGPFTCEWFGEDAEKLREAGAEYGAKTGRPRRVGPIDLVATRYGVEVQAATNIALTKLDILSYMDKIPVCAHYELDGQQTDEFPFPVCFRIAKPVIEYVDGWKCDISKARSWGDVPGKRPGLGELCGAGHRLSHRLCLRGRGAGQPHSSIRKNGTRQRRSISFACGKFFFLYNKYSEKRGRAFMSKDIYESPLSSRYASPYMLHLFSPDMRFQTWRRLWVALARAEHELGLPITAEQVAELEAHVTDIDYEMLPSGRRRSAMTSWPTSTPTVKAAPSAAGIIHLGATSCYVTDNADLILYRDGLRYLRGQILSVLVNLSAFARQYAATPTLGYTHYQPAQPVTVGKRAALWMQDFRSDLEELDHVLAALRFLGCRGTTGTEASFMDLFEGDGAKIDEMNRRIAAEFGFEKCFAVCGQTYPRKVDSRILNCLSSIAQSCYRMANDLRLLQHDRQLEEPFEADQIGSSAMAYKRNPMRSERICSCAAI